MNLARLWTIARLELLQRVRSVAWYVLLGVFAALLVGVTALSFLSYGGSDQQGPGVYAIVVFFTLLLTLLVAPTLSGNSINGDRDAATLAPMQVTLATTGEILLGKFVAAWITGLAFAVVAAPFLVVATLAGGVEPLTVIVSLAILVVETAVIAAIGVALSGILARPLFSVAVTYLVVAALTVGTPIAFWLASTAFPSEHRYEVRYIEYDPQTGMPECIDGSDDCGNDLDEQVCGDWQVDVWSMPRTDRVWWLLAVNPFVILADAVPAQTDRQGNPTDTFGYLKLGVRSSQLAPDLESRWDECQPWEEQQEQPPAYEEILAQTAPSWFVGLGVQGLMAGGLLWWAWARTRTPARNLPPGTRIA